jgi:hypothetical protein
VAARPPVPAVAARLVATAYDAALVLLVAAGAALTVVAAMAPAAVIPAIVMVASQIGLGLGIDISSPLTPTGVAARAGWVTVLDGMTLLDGVKV